VLDTVGDLHGPHQFPDVSHAHFLEGTLATASKMQDPTTLHGTRRDMSFTKTYLLAPGHERVVALVQYIVKTERYQEVQTSEARLKSGRCEWRDILSNSNKGIYGQM
jgi:hypothetical protein